MNKTDVTRKVGGHVLAARADLKRTRGQEAESGIGVDTIFDDSDPKARRLIIRLSHNPPAGRGKK